MVTSCEQLTLFILFTFYPLKSTEIAYLASICITTSMIGPRPNPVKNANPIRIPEKEKKRFRFVNKRDT